MTTRVLSRWAEAAGSPPCAQWPRIQDALISSVCRLVPQDQVRARAGRAPSVLQGLGPAGSPASGRAWETHRSEIRRAGRCVG